MNLELNGRVAMIAAASKGLGKACTLALAAEGCCVSISARNAETLEATRAEAAQHAEALAVTADISSKADLEHWHAETIKQFGHVDILITNTGGPPVNRFMELTEDQWQAGVESTLMNVIRMSRLVIPAMIERRWGRIIHLTSLVAKQPWEDLTISSTLRAGLSGLTKTMSNELGQHNITVNAILTGQIMTDRQTHLADIRTKARGISHKDYFQQQTADIPLRRIGEPKEFGGVVAFLASERASFITGVSLPVDGGQIRATM